MARSSLKNICKLIDVANGTFLPEQSFLNDLKRSIELTEEKNRRLPSKTYKPSSLHCIRNMWYQVTGKDLDTTTSNYCGIGICESGTDRHERIQNAVAGMKENNMDCEYIDVAAYVKSRNLDYLDIITKQGNETKLYHKNLNMSFLCDGIIKYKNKYYIIEFKTESIYKWQGRTGVADEHKLQATAYSVSLGIDQVLFVYINRDNTDMKAYMMDITNEMKQDLIGKIEECDGYVKRLICPPKPQDIARKTCEYCNYKNSCRKDG
jgi:CRISPR/Cas system-associated exonuclease Cas4 (RecB family)